jgi:hypothetical protein
MQETPDVFSLLKYVAEEVTLENERIKGLNFVAKRLGYGGAFHGEYKSSARASSLNFLPCVKKVPMESQDWKAFVGSPASCYRDKRCAGMGFPVLDPDLGDNRERFGEMFRCDQAPKNRQCDYTVLPVARKGARDDRTESHRGD